MKTTKVRIEDVARLAGVSTTAVSFAFNKPHLLNPGTVTRIHEIADNLGYAPNPYARALLSKSVGVIGILMPQALNITFANPFFANFYVGVGRICEENHLSLLTISTSIGTLAEASAKAPIDGLIILGLDETHEEVHTIGRRKLPIVIVDGVAERFPSVNIDDEAGAYQATEYLLAKGHRRIAFFTFEVDYGEAINAFGIGKQRLEGYQRAFAEYGLAWDDVHIIPSPASVEGSAETFRNYWQQCVQKPTAIVTIADAMALGILWAARDLGIRIPDDLAVVGFDDLPEASWASPPLTTVRQPIAEKGELAAQHLVALISGASSGAQHAILPTELMVRQTT